MSGSESLDRNLDSRLCQRTMSSFEMGNFVIFGLVWRGGFGMGPPSLRSANCKPVSSGTSSGCKPVSSGVSRNCKPVSPGTSGSGTEMAGAGSGSDVAFSGASFGAPSSGTAGSGFVVASSEMPGAGFTGRGSGTGVGSGTASIACWSGADILLDMAARQRQ